MSANHGNDPNRHIHNTDNEDTILIPGDIGNFAPPPQDNEMNAQQPYYGNQPNPFQQNGYEQPYQQPYYGNDPYANQQNPFAAGYDQQAQQQQYGYQQQPYTRNYSGQTRVTSNFCPNCGAPIQNTRFCGNCGYDIFNNR